MSEPTYLSTLNPAQKEAVLATEGPVLIVAGAGAGKTKTITHRIMHLIHSGVMPEKILAITFTNKAAAEMRERVRGLMADTRHDRTPFVSTFHAFGVYVLKEHAHLLGRTRHFTIMDEDDAVKLVKEAIIAEGYDIKQYEPKKIRGAISREKGRFTTYEDYAARADSFTEQAIAKCWRRYREALREEGAFDFDDLLVETVLIIQKHPEIREEYLKRFQYLHVDEYQDTNEVQYALTKLLVGPARNICVVGDTDQNIYSWRGANLKNMLHFERDFPNAKIIFLEQNYRSTKKILAAANAVIEKNTVRVPKKLFTEKEDGDHISMVEAYDEREEAGFVAEEVVGLIDHGVKAEDITVLYRANFQSRVLEEALLDMHVPYQVLGTRFYDRREIRDVLSYLKAALSPESLSQIKRIINTPARGIGKTTIAKLFSGQRDELPPATQKKINDFYTLLARIGEAAKTAPPSHAVKFAIEESGLGKSLAEGTEEDHERLENVRELVTLAMKYDALPIPEGMEKLIEDASLQSDQDGLTQEKRGVKLMTVHAAKGLEFPYVFIVGMEQDLFPHRRNEHASIEDREEERRLFYVALTRAMKKLYLSYATVRTLYGMRELTAPSEFLFDLPEHLLEKEVHQGAHIKTIYL